ncbi:hypothetical protein MAC_01459 [Metarhizium acridum CQMa 102]|uniref:UDENN FLCN/SMCR8-type domain-containing protein n=2 Tax=Metarhizium acridum TaxID=92637 RepID=E9DV69_METAQ|nr:uncharacterized protein MAC_01459 [Metarhizium acridum CQMa 102]EFY92493.1 hypothetical protein MAC_01459 [Metarhizium acridum CQMa 102]
MAIGTKLTTGLKLCLAHYCDIHGPTPLMVTEGLRSPCSVCFEEVGPTSAATGKTKCNVRTRSGGPTSAPQSQSSFALNDTFRDLSIGRSGFALTSEYDAHAQHAALRRSTTAFGNTNYTVNCSALETPPESPRPVFQQPRRDSSFRRTYDDTVTKKQGPCDNCAMTLPRRQTSGAATEDYATGAHGPTLRTKAPVERVFGAAGQTSPPNSQTSSDTDGDRETSTRRVRSRRTAPTASSSRNTSCSSTSTSSERTPYHFHYVSYTSTHEPILADSFSLIRASCLRALSFETLPRPPSTSTPTSSPQLNTSPSFVTTQSPGSAATGGPIFFGDALAGYTTAYIFRIPDVHARGHKRVYAFLALSTHKERLAMKTFAMISAAFRDLATWIQQLAEAEAERTTANSSPIGSVMYGGGAQPQPQPSVFDPPAAVDRSGSSFLTGGSAFTRRMGGGPGASSLKARGLAELVGQPDFFIELHGKFVQLLFEVGVALNS